MIQELTWTPLFFECPVVQMWWPEHSEFIHVDLQTDCEHDGERWLENDKDTIVVRRKIYGT
jgi:hypothetical protein